MPSEGFLSFMSFEPPGGLAKCAQLLALLIPSLQGRAGELHFSGGCQCHWCGSFEHRTVVCCVLYEEEVETFSDFEVSAGGK